MHKHTDTDTQWIWALSNIKPTGKLLNDGTETTINDLIKIQRTISRYTLYNIHIENNNNSSIVKPKSGREKT